MLNKRIIHNEELMFFDDEAVVATPSEETSTEPTTEAPVEETSTEEAAQ